MKPDVPYSWMTRPTGHFGAAMTFGVTTVPRHPPCRVQVRVPRPFFSSTCMPGLDPGRTIQYGDLYNIAEILLNVKPTRPPSFIPLEQHVQRVIDRSRPRPLSLTSGSPPEVTRQPATMPTHKDAILTRRRVESLIAQKNTIVVVQGRVLRVDPWLPYHPGGEKAIMHMVGRDATDEVTAYVCSMTQCRII